MCSTGTSVHPDVCLWLETLSIYLGQQDVNVVDISVKADATVEAVSRVVAAAGGHFYIRGRITRLDSGVDSGEEVQTEQPNPGLYRYDDCRDPFRYRDGHAAISAVYRDGEEGQWKIRNTHSDRT